MIKKSTGRSQITINWDEVDKYLIAGCNGQEIADILGICNDTLFNRCKEVHNMSFSDYSAKKRQKGNALLNMKQFQIAMNGNVSMLIWLGKQRLCQSEQPKPKEEFNGNLANLLDLFHLMEEGSDLPALIELAKKQKSSVNS